MKPTEIQCLRRLANELETLESLMKLKADGTVRCISVGGQHMSCFVTPLMLAEAYERVAEARAELAKVAA